MEVPALCHRGIEAAYVAFARSVSVLPNFRGKVRAGLACHRLLGLRGRHIRATVTLSRPLKYRMRLDLHCAHERMGLLMGGYEPEIPEFLAKCYSGQGYVLDIGANIGLVAIPWALLLRAKFPTADARVWCIEPIKSNSDSLRCNIQLNQLESNVSLLECCVGDTAGTVEISVEGNLRNGEGTGTANVLPTGSTFVCERIAVPVMTLDGLVSSGRLPPDCTLIKIDCDGYDYNVLRGAATLFAAARPVVFGEFMRHCLRWHGQTHADVVQFMNDLDYAPFYKSSSAPLRFAPFTPAVDVEQDLLFLPRESVERLAWCLENRATPAVVGRVATR